MKRLSSKIGIVRQVLIPMKIAYLVWRKIKDGYGGRFYCPTNPCDLVIPMIRRLGKTV